MEIIPCSILSRDIVERGKTLSAKSADDNKYYVMFHEIWDSYWLDMLSKIDTSKINLIFKANLHLLINLDSFLSNMPKLINDKFWKCDQMKQKILKICM